MKKEKMTMKKWKSRYYKHLIVSFALIVGSITTALIIMCCVPQPLSSRLYTILLGVYAITAFYIFRRFNHPRN